MRKQALSIGVCCLFGLAMLGTAAMAAESSGEPQVPREAPAVQADQQAEGPAAAPAPAVLEGSEVPQCRANGAVVGEENVAGGSEGAAASNNGWDPATCGTCGHYCTSDNACLGKLLGDRCSNNGATCQAFTGCALFNCCRCV